MLLTGQAPSQRSGAANNNYSASVGQERGRVFGALQDSPDEQSVRLPDRGGVIMVTGQESMAVTCVVHVSTWVNPIPRVGRNEL